jgi:carbon monoxide dehydrogenase subunit G
MKIEGSHAIKAPRDLLYQLMIDPEILRRCVPGLQSLEAAGDGYYKITLKLASAQSRECSRVRSNWKI